MKMTFYPPRKIQEGKNRGQEIEICRVTLFGILGICWTNLGKMERILSNLWEASKEIILWHNTNLKVDKVVTLLTKLQLIIHPFILILLPNFFRCFLFLFFCYIFLIFFFEIFFYIFLCGYMCCMCVCERDGGLVVKVKAWDEYKIINFVQFDGNGGFLTFTSMNARCVLKIFSNSVIKYGLGIF